MTEEATEERVRRRLRELRHEQGRTLDDVAAAANMATSTLSRLESGKRRLALDHLPALAAALEVRVDDLLGGPATVGDPRVTPIPREEYGATWWPLTRRGFQGLHAFRIRVDDDGRDPPETLPVHEGLDWIYVLSGRLRLVLGDREFVIEPGEAVEFSTLVPHWFGALDGPVEILSILGPDGRHVHEHGHDHTRAPGGR